MPRFAVVADPLVSGQVHGDSRVREGGASGAVCQGRRRGPANPRGRGRAVVSLSGHKERGLWAEKKTMAHF